ncbi:MAG TPA: ribose-phosphate pyrophosphokinase [Gemmatimonadaceae bacterium]|nr:ribose-phosphate pyrophosphokinase [Gemmatimonadaceae bacterium]
MDGLSVPSHGVKLLVGSGNHALSEEIARSLGVEPARLTINRFADGEIFVRIDENVRGNDVFILQPTNPPAENIMELLLLIDAAKRASAARITCVMPYYGYSRQDRKDQPRVAIGAKLVANMIVTAGANRVVGLDFHQHQLQGFFDIPVDHLYAAPVFVSHYRKKNLHDVVIVAPDVGSAKMARGFAKRLNGSLAIIDKRRPRPNQSEVVNVVGEVEGRDCILTDDMIDTAGTVAEASRALKQLGANDVYVCATHALLSGPAVERLSNAPIKEVTVTDTVNISEEKRFPQLQVLSVGELLAKAIRYIHSEQSVSSLFEG